MYQLSPQDNIDLRPLFNLPHLGFVVDAMQAGNSPATIWVDDLNEPRSAFIWDTSHSLYFAGNADNPAFNAAVHTLIADTILPEGRARQLGIFKIYSTSDVWTAQIPEMLQTGSLPVRERTLFRLEPPSATPQSPQLLPEFHIQPINRDLLADPARVNAENVLEEIGSCWTALDRFYAQGFGFCVVTDTGEIAGWCTAEYVSDGVCGVGIETVEAYQGQGIATMVALAFVQHCAAKGWTAHWDSWTTNLPSVKVAQKAGFKKFTDYSIQIYTFDT
jgi:RimJ/RimL family protein N-acetyltransferase